MSYSTNPLDALDAGGAYEIGGGAFNFGQGINEEYVRDLLAVPVPNPLDMFDAIRQALMKLPSDSLKAFDPYIDGVDTSADQETKVEAIMDSLIPRTMMTMEEFWEWIEDTFNDVSKGIYSILETVYNDVVTDIDEGIEAFNSWLSETVAKVQNLTSDGKLSAADLLDLLGLDQVDGLPELANLWDTTDQWLSRVITDLVIVSDILHFFYPRGTPSDLPTTTAGSPARRTWFSARNDLLEMLDIDPATVPVKDLRQTIDDIVEDVEQAFEDIGQVAADFLAFSKEVIGKLVNGGTNSGTTLTAGGFRQVPAAVLNAMSFDGDTSNFQHKFTGHHGGMKFNSPGWYSYNSAIPIAWNTGTYALTPSIGYYNPGTRGDEVDYTPLLWGQTYTNPAFPPTSSVIIQCSGLLKVTQADVDAGREYLPGYALSTLATVSIESNASVGALFFTAVKIKDL